LGLVSILAGWTFVAPIAGLVTGVLALGREPYARTMALWGIVLNAVMLAGVFLLLVLGLILGSRSCRSCPSPSPSERSPRAETDA
ncbi:hypothetical protein, partial [Pseudomonas sp. AB12(2023)]|uniref:hypothetical protein n=1 Tax=Pseudomonas sp. AB12(2023) TaxID=3048597 RepID=UPI002B222FF3